MPIIKEVKWGQDNDLDAVPTLTEEDQYALKKRMEAMDQLLAEAKKAKYKIELLVASDYRSGQPFVGALSIWESGAKLHGGGDTKVYECPGKELGKSNCTGLIGDSSQGYGHLVCPDCREVWQGPQVIGERIARLSKEKWAGVLYKTYVRVGHNADIRLKRPRFDIRAAAAAEQEKQRGGDVLRRARSLETVIYPLVNIIKDVSAGADPVLRFKALLSA